jgi:glycosyltransferase involved in cell wall biosynthesis
MKRFLNTNRIVFWGTYDKGKPRTRLLIEGVKSAGFEVIECHANIWNNIEDKSQMKGAHIKLVKLFRFIMSYPILLFRYMKLPKHDIVVVGYLGNIDIIMISFFAWIRNAIVCWDIFLSLYDTVVIDRELVSTKSFLAKLLYFIEWIGSRAADIMLLDTQTHATYFESLYQLPPSSVDYVFVGAENIFNTRQVFQNRKNYNFTILFYGQFIPLHGIEYIIKAAKIVENQGYDFRWVLIGKGQEATKIDNMIKNLNLTTISRIPWVEYNKLTEHILDANICLGIFTPTGKGTRVIPNKIYQILAAGKPLITGDTPAIRELKINTDIITLVPPGNPEMIAKSIILKSKLYAEGDNTRYYKKDNLKFFYDYQKVGIQFKRIIYRFNTRNYTS